MFDYRNGDGASAHLPRRFTLGSSDRTSPFSLEAEAGVLGAVLLDPSGLPDVAILLAPDDFFLDTHGKLWSAILDLSAAGKPTDPVSVGDELTRRGEFAGMGGDVWLSGVMQSVPHAANVRYHAGIVREKAAARRLIEAANDILGACYSNESTAAELVERAETLVFAVADRRSQTADVHEGHAATGDAIEECERRLVGLPKGVMAGFTELDETTYGFCPQKLYIVAARPAMGKTAFGLQIAEHAATDLRRQTRALFVSLEMGRLELGERLLSAATRLDGDRLRNARDLTPGDWNKLKAAHAAQYRSRLAIDDTPGRTVGQICAVARRERSRNDLGLLVVDYLQLVEGPRGRGESRQEEVARISKRFKNLARELSVPVVVLAQLNRELEKREDHRPRMADLRESGAIEQDADCVIFLHRPEYYNPNDKPGIAEVIIAKNRSGRTGVVELLFEKHLTKFSPLPFQAAGF